VRHARSQRAPPEPPQVSFEVFAPAALLPLLTFQIAWKRKSTATPAVSLQRRYSKASSEKLVRAHLPAFSRDLSTAIESKSKAKAQQHVISRHLQFRERRAPLRVRTPPTPEEKSTSP
jgi:hypothetical protein